MVDKARFAALIADVRDAVARIRAVLPADTTAFESDRTTREVVVLNLFVALQQCLALASHWLADAGSAVPGGNRELFAALADAGVLDPALAQRLAAAAGLRNLIAHRYGVLDWRRIHQVAATELDDLLAFCKALAANAAKQG